MIKPRLGSTNFALNRGDGANRKLSVDSPPSTFDQPTRMSSMAATNGPKPMGTGIDNSPRPQGMTSPLGGVPLARQSIAPVGGDSPTSGGAPRLPNAPLVNQGTPGLFGNDRPIGPPTGIRPVGPYTPDPQQPPAIPNGAVQRGGSPNTYREWRDRYFYNQYESAGNPTTWQQGGQPFNYRPQTPWSYPEPIGHLIDTTGYVHTAVPPAPGQAAAPPPGSGYEAGYIPPNEFQGFENWPGYMAGMGMGMPPAIPPAAQSGGGGAGNGVDSGITEQHANLTAPPEERTEPILTRPPGRAPIEEGVAPEGPHESMSSLVAEGTPPPEEGTGQDPQETIYVNTPPYPNATPGRHGEATTYPQLIQRIMDSFGSRLGATEEERRAAAQDIADVLTSNQGRNWRIDWATGSVYQTGEGGLFDEEDANLATGKWDSEFGIEVNREAAERRRKEKADADRKGPPGKTPAQQSVDDFLAQGPPQLDQAALEASLAANARGQAIREGQLMLASGNAAAQVHADPNVAQGRQAAIGQQGAAVRAGIEADSRLRAQATNFQAQLQHYNMQWAAVMQKLQTEQDDKVRATLFEQQKQLIALGTQAQLQYQEAMAELSRPKWWQYLLGIGGTAIGSLFGGVGGAFGAALGGAVGGAAAGGLSSYFGSPSPSYASQGTLNGMNANINNPYYQSGGW